MTKRFCVFVFLFVLATLFASAAPIIVSPSQMNGWVFVTESGSGTGQMVNGPSTPPLGTGSAQLAVAASGDRELLATLNYNGTLLSEIMMLSYDTYRSSGGPALAPSLQFDIDTDTTDNNTSWMGRLVYEPYYTQTVLDNTWQSWNTMTTGANWWFSGAPGNAACSIGSPCSWAQVLNAFPNAGINGALQFKAGGGWSNFVGNVDNFSIQRSRDRSANVYNFEHNEIPEPGTYALMAGGLGILIVLKRRTAA